ncbi:protein disulfide-isomerase domain [Paracoccidioides brasiliensis Pb18]|uniref:protein disulfide-isomerase n=1 Tax=Paracoccidioides brasiliensis (strain Pb18) TaxID=502780 RepID=C1GEE2_PARBD|nr:protein disulfide-isomerase domain [Paracoccidioides brasiliensis Pb18]EEH49549.1 protein disulfide-isomerase domain [Paracoccidioides brasiliensis Pb18]
MTRLSYLLLTSAFLLTSIVPVTAKSAVLDLIPDNFDSVVLKSGKPGLVKFFAPWCGHCRNLAPIYDQLADVFANENVHISKVDADEHKDLGRKFGVQGFPTLKWFDGKSEQPIEYNGGRDLESLVKFVSEKAGVKLKGAHKPPSNVQMLTDATFSKTVGGDKHVIVAFTAPWCGHCKNLAPIWEKLADDFKRESKVIVAKVDAEAENSRRTAEAQGVNSYPTIKFFPAGDTSPYNYEGGRSEEDLVAYVNRNAGTHRLVGGGLDKEAGTIDILDMIVVRYVNGGKQDLAGSLYEAKVAAKGLKDQYAQYYVKVWGKLAENQDYVTKELARLEGILKKGGLALEKVDDLISRSNILRKFLWEKEEEKKLEKDEL